MAHILVIEDNEDVASMMRDVLVAAGYRCSVATTAAQARTYMEAVAPDVVITDVLLPRETGLALAEKLRKQGVPVIITTGSIEAAEELSQHGVPYLAKPFRLRDLTLAIERALVRVGQPGEA